MSNYLEAAVFCKLEALRHCLHCVTSVSISGNVFVNTLNSNLDSRASIVQHIVKMRLEAVVRSRFDGDTDTL